MTVEGKALRHALGTFITGVTVVTTSEPETGVPLGFTANSFTSVSLDPPLILVCLGRAANVYPVFEQASGFAVNILAADQREIANRFASPLEDRFGDLDWRLSPLDNPIFAEVSAWFDCRFDQRFVAGDHMVMIGEVHYLADSDHPGLGYARGSYFNEGLEKQALDAVSRESPIRAGAIVEYQGKLLLLGEDEHWTVPSSTPQSHAAEAMSNLKHHLETLGVEGELGWLYAVEQEGHQAFSSMYFHVLATHVAGSLPQGAEMVPMQEVAERRLSKFEAGVLERYVCEHRRGRFGIYFGTEENGSIRIR